MVTNVSPAMTLETLRSVPLFEPLDEVAAAGLLELIETREVGGGVQLFRAGDTGDAMYLIAEGQVLISIVDEDGQRVTLAELGPGDFFGEMALFDGKPRSADATTIDHVRLAVLSREHFLSFVRANPDVALVMLSAIAERLRRTDQLLRQRASRNANEEEEARLTLADRVADRLTEFGGSWWFIGATVVFIVAWIGLSLRVLRYEPLNSFFDSLGMMDVVNGVIAAILGPILLISQNRQSDKDRLRADLDYQVNLKNELVLGEILRRLDALESERLPSEHQS